MLFLIACIYKRCRRPGWLNELGRWIYQLIKAYHQHAWVRARLCKLQKGQTRLAVSSDKVYQLLAHGRWFSPGTPAVYTTTTGRHDIADILLKVLLKHQIIKSLNVAVAEQIIKRARVGMSLVG